MGVLFIDSTLTACQSFLKTYCVTAQALPLISLQVLWGHVLYQKQCLTSSNAGVMKSYCVLGDVLPVSRLQLSLMPIMLPDDALSLSKDKHHEDLLCE